MPKLIRLTDEGAAWVDDRFTTVADDESPPQGDIIISLSRYLAEGEALAPAIERLLADPRVAYLHAHYARRGCYAARIERP